MKSFKAEYSPDGMTKEEFVKKVTEDAQAYANLHSKDFEREQMINQIPSLVAKHLGSPSIKTITQVLDLLAPYSKKYSSKVKTAGGEKVGRKTVSPTEKAEAIASLKAGEKPADVAKKYGKSTAWAYALKSSGARSKAQKKKSKAGS